MFKCIYNGEKKQKPEKLSLAKTIRKMIEEDPQVVYLDADLMNSIGTSGLEKSFPNR
jgi:transketolase